MGTLDEIEEVEEFVKIYNFMDDEEVGEALKLVRKSIRKPDVPAEKVSEVIYKVQGLATQFQIIAAFYKTIGYGSAKTEAGYKRNLYSSLADALDKLVAALKYQAR